MVPEHGEITELLHRWRAGNSDAENELFARLLPELRRVAQCLMKGERKGHTLQATELVDQVYLRLVKAKDQDWRSRQHFLAIAARAMRRYLIDHARARKTGQFVAVDGIENILPANDAKLDEAIAVDRLLERLQTVNPQWCTLVELKYFLGLTDDEAADALGLKLRTMQRMWLEARQWLFTGMEPASDVKRAGR